MNSESTSSPDQARLRRRHLSIGWWSLLCFALLGIALEALHAWKVDAYLHPAHETRRLLLRLAHAHGIGLALLHVAFAFTAATLRTPPRVAGACMTGALLAMPIGFLLGGIGHSGGDPGAGIALVPLGALLLLIAIGSTAWSLREATDREPS
jgi:hypothetical protein